MKVVLLPGMTVGLKRTDASKTSMSLGVLAIASILDTRGVINVIADIDAMAEKLTSASSDDFYAVLGKKLAEEKGDLYGFYVAVGTLHHAVSMIREIRRYLPDCKTVLGGPHASAAHLAVMEAFPEVDFIARSESEDTIVELVEAIEQSGDYSTIRGLTYRCGDQVTVNENRELNKDLNKLPSPAYEKFDLGKEVLDVIPIDVGRGCPYSCSFCSTSVFWRRTYRLKGNDRIIEEMKMVKNTLGARKVFIMHDCFTVSKEAVKEFCERVRQENLGLRWGCAARIDHLDEEMLDILKYGGCTHIELGIESASTSLRSIMNKKISLEDKENREIIQNIRHIHDKGFSLVLFFMCGFPDETDSDLLLTLRLIGETLDILRGNGFIRLTNLALFPGSPIFESSVKEAVNDPMIMPETGRKLYTSDMLKKGAKESSLFPELYYLPNKHGIPHARFENVSLIVSSFVKLLGTEFYLSYRILYRVLKIGIPDLVDYWIKFEQKLGVELREAGVLVPQMLPFVSFLEESGIIPSTFYLKEVLRYELLGYRCRQHYLKSYKGLLKSPNGISKACVFFDCFTIDIQKVIACIKKDRIEEIDADNNQRMILALPLHSEAVSMAQIDEKIISLIEACDGTRSADELANCLCNDYGHDKNKEQFMSEIQQTISQLIDAHVLLAQASPSNAL